MADDTRVTHSRSRFAFVLVLLLALGSGLPATARAGDIIVRRDAGLSASERADVRSDAGVELERMLRLRDTEVVSVPDGREAEALKALNADPDVVLRRAQRRRARRGRRTATDVAEPDPPNDPGFGSRPRSSGPAMPTSTLRTPGALSAGPSRDGSWSGVADQRVDVTHDDLEHQIDAAHGTTSRSRRCTAGAPTGTDDHGTHVAGSVAAESDNGIGIAGVAPAAKIVPLRALDNCGGGTLQWVVDAFDYAGRPRAGHRRPRPSATDRGSPRRAKPAINDLIAATISAHPTRSTSSPPATKATTTTPSPSTPATRWWRARIRRTWCASA